MWNIFNRRYRKWNKSKLKENIKCLEELSITLQQSIKNLKKIFDKINEDKEKLKYSKYFYKNKKWNK